MNLGFRELHSFHQFLGAKLQEGSNDVSPEKALQEWRDLHPDPLSFEDDLAAIEASLEDMVNGAKGRPVEDVLSEIRGKYGLSSPS